MNERYCEYTDFRLINLWGKMLKSGTSLRDIRTGLMNEINKRNLLTLDNGFYSKDNITIDERPLVRISKLNYEYLDSSINKVDELLDNLKLMGNI